MRLKQGSRRGRFAYISIHAPQWGATWPRGEPRTCQRFQSTHPSGVRLGRDGRGRRHGDFNPRTPVGCDFSLMGIWTTDDISIHAPQWGATCCPAGRSAWNANFNPRTPVGCDQSPVSSPSMSTRISIHAPQWGATQSCENSSSHSGISIHAPQWGATKDYTATAEQYAISIHAPQWGATVRYQCFQSGGVISIHAPQWGATRSPFHASLSQSISIHAPQWGATGRVSHCATLGVNFNPRTPVGCDLGYLPFPSSRFQSTHPSGVRRQRSPGTHRSSVSSDFNPRTPVGCDRENGHSIP